MPVREESAQYDGCRLHLAWEREDGTQGSVIYEGYLPTLEMHKAYDLFGYEFRGARSNRFVITSIEFRSNDWVVVGMVEQISLHERLTWVAYKRCYCGLC